jgi:flagellar protein FliS
MTANQGQLIIMLHDGILKSLDEAVAYMKQNTQGKVKPALIEKTGRAVIKAEAMISELSVSLDFEQGKEIARSLFALYRWFCEELLDANIHSDAVRILAVRKQVADLRSSWIEVIEKAPPQQIDRNFAASSGGEQTSINLAG